jgi:hypothetical protein
MSKLPDASAMLAPRSKGHEMRTIQTERGFIMVECRTNSGDYRRLVQESSAIGPYDDAIDNPGSSYLWVGEDHHLNREDVRELIRQLQHWFDNKRLPTD